MSKVEVIAGSGGKKGGGGSESADTLKSSSKLAFVDVLGEGQIKGLVNGEQSIFFDNTPLKNRVGQNNFTNVSYDIAHGTQDQDPLRNGYIDGVEYATSLNLKISKHTPITFTITDPNADSVNVVLSVPNLTHTDGNGNIGGSSVDFSFEVSTNDGPFVFYARDRISGKTRSKYQKAFSGNLPKTDTRGNKATRWTIRVNRTSDDSSNSSTQNDLYIDSYSVIINSKLSYPNTAILGCSIDAEHFSSIPRRSYLVDGLLIKVPANRDSITRTYSGIWNGQFKLEATDNPAWILYDILSNERYGLGQYIPAEYRNPARLYEIGKYCDEMVDDGFGNKEPRFSINTVISSLVEAYQLITDIASVFNGMIYWTGNDMGYMCDMPSEISMIYNPSNIIGDITYQSSDRKDRHSVVVVSYNNPNNNYDVEQEYIEDPELVDKLGVRKTEIVAFGCTTRGQAHRVGKWVLYTEKYQSSMISFSVGIDSAFVFPGDIIQIIDPDRAGKRLGGRLKSFTSQSAILDDNIDLTNFTNTHIVIRLQDGTLAKRTIKTVGKNIATGTSIVTWTNPIDKGVVTGAIWIISTQQLEPITARVISVTQGDSDYEYNITAVKHEPEKFKYIESDVKFQPTVTSIIDHNSISPTELVVVRGEKRIEQGITQYSINIQWQQVKNASHYLVRYRKENGNWVELPQQTGLSVDVDNVYSGNYEAVVIAVSSLGVKSRPTISAISSISGTASKLTRVQNLSASGVLFGIDLGWNFTKDALGVLYTEIQQKRSSDGEWENLTNVMYPNNHYNLTGLGAVETRHFRARLVDGFAEVGEWSDIVVGSTLDDPQSLLSVLDGHITESTFDRALTSKIDVIQSEILGSKRAIQAESTARTQAIQQANQAIARESQQRTDAIRAETTARTQAIQAESNARTQAINAEIRNRTDAINSKATEVRNAITPQITALQQGLSQETQQRQTADAQTLSALNAYKLSNDSALAVVLNKADTAIRENASQASQLTALNSAMQTANQQIATKLNASAIQNYYTKAETNNAVAGKINEFNASLNIGGYNIWSVVDLPVVNEVGFATKSIISADNEHYRITLNSFNNLGRNLQRFDGCLVDKNHDFSIGDDYIFSFEIRANKTAILANIYTYFGALRTSIKYNLLQVTEQWQKVEILLKANGTNKTATSQLFGIGLYDNDGWAIDDWYEVRYVQMQRGTKSTSYHKANAVTQNLINANAQAIQNINSSVTNINGTLTSQSGQLAQFRTDLNQTNQNLNQKADASALSTLDSKVTQQGTQIASQSSKVAQLENNLNATNQNLATKANATTVSVLDNRVAQVDNRVTAESQKLVQLTSTVNQNQANLVAQYYTKADADNMASGKIEQYKASLDSESLVYDYLSNHADSWASFYTNVNLANDIQTINDGKVSKTVYRKTTSQPNSWNYNLKGLPNNQRYKLSMWVRRSTDSTGNCYFTVLLRNSNEVFNPRTTNYTSHTLTIPTDNQWHLISAIVDFSQRPFDIVHFGFSLNHTARVGQAEMQGFKVEKVLSINDVDSSFASSQALSNLQNTVTRQGTTLDSQSTQITQLRNDLTATNANLNSKANSSALDSLDSRVRQQGQDISVINAKTTQLESGVSSINQSLLTKANTSAVSNLESRVGSIDGRVNSQAGQITRLESGLDTKANITALSNYYTRAETDNVIGGKVEEFKATLDNTSLLPDPNMTDVNSWRSHYDYGIVQYLKTVTDGKIAPTVFRKDKSNPNGCWNYSNTSVPNNRSYKLSAWVRRASTSVGLMYFTYRFLNSSQDANAFLPAQYGYVGVSVPADDNWHFVTATVDLTSRTDIAKIFFGFAIGHDTSSDYWELQGFRCEPVLSSNDIDNSIATSNALQQTNANVSRIDGVVLSQGQSITKLTNDLDKTNSNLARKAESSALSALDNRVTQQGNNITSQATKLSQLESNLNQKANATALNSLESTVNNINGRVNAQASQYTTLQSTVNGQTATIQQQTQSINGVKAMHVFKMDVNGVISGWGMMSDVQNGRVTSQFGVNADTFYIGSPSNGKKPFIFNTSPRMIDGIQYPAGAFINSAYIADASIKLAKIDKASIQSLSALSANIGHFKSAQTGARLEIKDGILLVYDANNRLRVRLGVW